MKRRLVGLFGGTFDPVHFGHLNLAIGLKEIHGLESVLFCPAAISPHKQTAAPFVTDEQRLDMLKLAIEPVPSFTILDRELGRPPPSYTIDTVRWLLDESEKKGEKIELRLLMGEDALAGFESWKDVKELVKLAPPLIGTRSSITGFERGSTRIPVMEISSTLLRKRLSDGLYCGHLIPAKVLDYIQSHRLYYSSL